LFDGSTHVHKNIKLQSRQQASKQRLEPDAREIKVRKIRGISTQAMKAYRGSRGILPLIIYLGVKFSSVVNIESRPLYPREENFGTT
jgi:hypothetical protein